MSLHYISLTGSELFPHFALSILSARQTLTWNRVSVEPLGPGLAWQSPGIPEYDIVKICRWLTVPLELWSLGVVLTLAGVRGKV